MRLAKLIKVSQQHADQMFNIALEQLNKDKEKYAQLNHAAQPKKGGKNG